MHGGCICFPAAPEERARMTACSSNTGGYSRRRRPFFSMTFSANGRSDTMSSIRYTVPCPPFPSTRTGRKSAAERTRPSRPRKGGGGDGDDDGDAWGEDDAVVGVSGKGNGGRGSGAHAGERERRASWTWRKTGAG
ncbi:hypothetical protein GSI_12572 [Ganoderma sinense ZZ0214-1]|uniref:Uncharacterized protein n=1 Tax=Ganoderma sinense ZZ0214-1 TaxID=1077348 RepID=A0A2G8RTL5_9APHY|nr:hypothetical protein GSI_12572 [Ganoderma sinense ZZ0214-1]